MKCSQCYHDGCCEGLPYCGGSKFVPAYARCPVCGGIFHVDDMGDDMCLACSENSDDEPSDDAIREEREAWEIDKADAKRKGLQ